MLLEAWLLSAIRGSHCLPTHNLSTNKPFHTRGLPWEQRQLAVQLQLHTRTHARTHTHTHTHGEVREGLYTVLGMATI